MRYLLPFAIFILMSCGGGGSSAAASPSPSPSPSSSTELTLLPGSVNSFQPLDIDDWSNEKTSNYFNFNFD